MAKTALFSFVRVSDNSMVASVRIARWLQSKFKGAPLVWEKEIGDMTDLDTLIIVNGAYGFSKVLEPLSRAISGAKNVVWCQNDYTIIPPRTEGDAQSPFRKAFVDRKAAGQNDTIFWSTCEKWYSLPGSHYVNWNQLTFDEQYDEKMIGKRRRGAGENLFYYGSYRDGSGKSSRVPIFDRYFRDPAVTTIVSSPVDKFAKRYPKIETVGAITDNFFAVLSQYGMGLYIEDRKSSEEFHSPANRFYEMLSAGLPMAFQPESGSMMRKAGFNPDPYTAGNAREIKRLMAHREDIGKEQRKAWVQSPTFFRDNLETQLKTARKAIGL